MPTIALVDRIMSGGVVAAAADSSVVGGIVIFAVGIVVGLVSVLTMEWRLRQRLTGEYEQWLAAGRPERRMGERRSSPPKKK